MIHVVVLFDMKKEKVHSLIGCHHVSREISKVVLGVIEIDNAMIGTCV